MIAIKFIGTLVALFFINKKIDIPIIPLSIAIYVLYTVCALIIPLRGLKKFPITMENNNITNNSKTKWIVVSMLIIAFIVSIIEICIKCFITGATAYSGKIDSILFLVFIANIVIYVLMLPIIYSYTAQKLVIDRIICHGEKKAVLFSAAMFFVVNLVGGSIQYWVISSFILGLALAYIYIKTSNIKYCMIINILFNMLFYPQIAIKIAGVINNLVISLF